MPAQSSRDAFLSQEPSGKGDMDLSVRIAGLELVTPVLPASGCFGPELGRLIPVEEIGATVTKTVFTVPRGGNPAHRLTEIEQGVVNSVGIPSGGPRDYLERLHPLYRELGVPTIISIGGHRPGEYASVVQRLNDVGDAYELNVSCPNLEREGVDIGADPEAIRDTVRQVRNVTSKPLIVKLPSMASSIAQCARSAEDAGADAVCLANSIPVLALDAKAREPALGNLIGGLTGPQIRPIVLRLVWLAARAIGIPVIACGGVGTADDALEYFSVGAKAVQVGTANFARPFAMVEIVRELVSRCETAGVRNPGELLATRML